MKAFFRWIGRIVASALTIILAVILFPYASKWAAKLLPDESGAAIKASAVIASRLENSARLETLRVEEDGVLNYDIQAAFVGSVANINASYTYEASFGIDLAQVEIRISGNEITFILPSPEVLQDNLTPAEVYRDDFWYPGFSDQDYQQLLESERLARREAYLSGEYEDELWDATVAAFQETIAGWMTNIHGSLSFQYQKALPEETN